MSSNWVSAFIRPEPMDPNDRVRQKTQSRGGVYPYDKPVSYGASSHAGMNGDERQDGADDGPPLGRQHKTPRPMTAWDRIADSLSRTEMAPTELGPQSASAAPLGYGNHGRMGEDGMDALELEMDSLRNDFRQSYENSTEVTDEMCSTDLFSLLTDLDPDFAAQTFAPEDEDEMRNIYGIWADRMSSPEDQTDEDQNY